MRNLDVKIRTSIEARDDEWARLAKQLAETIPQAGGKPKDLKGQLRNLQAVAERSNSWAAFDLFIHYQVARNTLPPEWVSEAARVLGELKRSAESITGGSNQAAVLAPLVHMELVSRVLGYTIRWHMWKLKE